MKSKVWVGVLLGAALACVAQPSLAQDKGKTAAAELASQSRAALQQLYASVPLAKQLGPIAHAILGLSRRSRRPASESAVSMARARS